MHAYRGVERLERRRFLTTVTYTYGADQSAPVIARTAGDDRIEIVFDRAGYPVARINGVDSGLTPSTDNIIRIDGRRGNDYISLPAYSDSDIWATSKTQVIIYGGAGNDTIIGSGMTDRI